MELNWTWKEVYEKLKKITIMCIEHLGDPYYQGSAATIAYFMFLSVLPIVILGSQALGLFSLSIDTILRWAEINVSGGGFELIQSLLKHGASTSTNNVILFVIVEASTAALVSIWFVGGCTLISLGVVGEYIGKIYIEVKERPQYNIEDLL